MPMLELFHGSNGGSNPPGDANKNNGLASANPFVFVLCLDRV